MILTMGAGIATPDIETQYGPDNYMGSHSISSPLTSTPKRCVMATVMLDEQWTVQAASTPAPTWRPGMPGAMPTGMFGVRWVSEDNNDSSTPS